MLSAWNTTEPAHLREDAVSIAVMELQQAHHKGLPRQRGVRGQLQDGSAVGAVRQALEPAPWKVER